MSCSVKCPTPAPGLRQSLRPVRADVIRVALAGLATLVGVVVGAMGGVAWPAYLLALLLGGAPAAWEALGDLRRREINVDLLMVIAAIGAVSIGAWFEGALLLTLFALGGLLEEISLHRTESAVAALMSLRPDVVRVVSDGGTREVAPGEVAVGETIRVLPGERVALDGVVAGTGCRLDCAALTGESTLRAVTADDEVPAGAIVADAPVELRVTRTEAESTLSRMIALVSEAREGTTRAGTLIERWLGRYVIAVLILTAVAYVALTLMGSDDAVLQAMTLLVVASPCALVIGLPATLLSALASAARAGVLAKGGEALLRLGEARVMMFDKTGTLTTGELRIDAVEPCAGIAPDEVLALAAACEAAGGHPLARAICAAAPDVIPDATNHLVLPGEGVQATIVGETVAVLSPLAAIARGADSAGLQVLEESSGACVMRGDELLGVITVSDPLRADAAGALADLRALGVTSEIISGDRPALVARIGAAVGADRALGGLTPEAKLAHILAGGENVVMVGDGINDAPALASAHVGVAMGGRGTDQALEAGDVVLMADRLERLPFAVALARRTRRVLAANMIFATAMIAVLIIATLIGDLPLPLGVIGHEGSTVLVTLNGLRLLAARPSGMRRRSGSCPGPVYQDGAVVCGRLATG